MRLRRSGRVPDEEWPLLLCAHDASGNAGRDSGPARQVRGTAEDADDPGNPGREFREEAI